MKVEKLIEALQKVPTGTEVCITDWNKSIHYSDGSEEGTQEGIYPDFSVDYTTQEDVAKGSKPFVALAFKNEDYTELGEKVE